MKRLQAFKFQLRPGGQQECEMRRFAGACRFVFNRALAGNDSNLLIVFYVQIMPDDFV
ncbi:helix-turn-helix domain-containing protein, partial [Escherichia coli]|uniref:helix-turn-helix domain-containing protein n=1 Tax=Escherichia coli TaxID=562 RepID=UPI003FD0351A